MIKRVLVPIGLTSLAVLLFPIRLWTTLRRSMTTTSITLLLATIVTLNIVWGYPWIGMFAACLALGVVGGLACWYFRPSLRVDIKLPLSAAATQPFLAQIHLTNRRRIPALDLRVGFDVVPTARFFQRWRGPQSEPIETSVAMPMNLIRSHGHDWATASLRYSNRGIHQLPRVMVESSFPFHLFRTVRRIDVPTSIAITPRPLALADANVAQTMFKTIEELTSRLCVGESLEYTGSREYQPGVPVRRWDFGSWARLGRPIVREFQSSSFQTVWLVIDTAADVGTSKHSASENLERLLSCAAAVIPQWLQRRVRLRMYVSSEQPGDHGSEPAAGTVSDAEGLQIRLAAAERVANSVADQRLVETLELAGRKPILLLTSREILPSSISQLSHCNVVRCLGGDTP